MFRVRGISAKLRAIMLVVAVLSLAVAGFAIWMIDQLAETNELMLQQYVPLSRCAEQALLAVSEANDDFHAARRLQSPEQVEQIRELEKGLQQNMIAFDMFIKAMVWGTKSEAFQRSDKGQTQVRWRKEDGPGSWKCRRHPIAFVKPPEQRISTLRVSRTPPAVSWPSNADCSNYHLLACSQRTRNSKRWPSMWQRPIDLPRMFTKRCDKRSVTFTHTLRCWEIRPCKHAALRSTRFWLFLPWSSLSVSVSVPCLPHA